MWRSGRGGKGHSEGVSGYRRRGGASAGRRGGCAYKRVTIMVIVIFRAARRASRRAKNGRRSSVRRRRSTAGPREKMTFDPETRRPREKFPFITFCRDVNFSSLPKLAEGAGRVKRAARARG